VFGAHWARLNPGEFISISLFVFPCYMGNWFDVVFFFRPWYADRNQEAAYDAAHRLYYRRVPTMTSLCTDDVANNYTAPSWCADPIGEDPPLGKAQCTGVDAVVNATCNNVP